MLLPNIYHNNNMNKYPYSYFTSNKYNISGILK